MLRVRGFLDIACYGFFGVFHGFFGYCTPFFGYPLAPKLLSIEALNFAGWSFDFWTFRLILASPAT